MTQLKQNWAFDYSHSKIGFSVRHFGIAETEGYFKSFEASILNNTPDFSDAQIEVNITVDSIDTNDVQRDAHLKNTDFFDAEKYPLIKFQSTSLTKVTNEDYILNGLLTMLNQTHPVSFKVEFGGILEKDPFGNTKAGFLVEGKINRKDWGIVWNAALDKGGIAVSETVKIKGSIQLLKL